MKDPHKNSFGVKTTEDQIEENADFQQCFLIFGLLSLVHAVSLRIFLDK